jgi:hypothetical protein
MRWLIGGLRVCGLGRSRTYRAPFSETLAVLRTDRHLRRFVERDIRRLEKRVLSIVRANREALLAMAERLMEPRHLGGDEARAIKLGARHLQATADHGVRMRDGRIIADPGFITALPKIARSYGR